MPAEYKPSRTILLVDMNAFFISCEMLRHPELRGLPAAVAGDPKKRTGIILAASYEARAWGVRTAMVLHEALQRCPQMRLVPPDHAFYEQISDQVMAWLGHFTPLVEPNSIDEAWLDITGCAPLFGTPVETATRIRDEIRDILGLWCSIGIAENKFLAKMASELKKPLGITEIWPDDLAGKLWPLPVRAMYGVGAKTADKLQTVGIRSIGDLAAIDPAFLVSLLGKSGHELSRHARGLDDEPVRPPDAGAMKSVGRSTTLVTDLSDLDQAKRVLLALADDVGRSLRRYDKKGHTVQLTLKSADFQVMTRQTSVALTSATQEIYQAGCSLLEQNWRAAKPVRLIGISVSGFDTPALYDQISLADLAGQASGRRQQTGHDRIDRAMDAIRNRYGKDKITYGKLVSTDKERLELHGQDISDTAHPEEEQNERFTDS